MDDLGALAMRWRWSTSAKTISRLRSLADDLEQAAGAAGVTECPSALLTSWSFGTRPVPCLVGHAFGHPNIDDGRRAITSEVYYVDPDRRLARTLSRWYRLGSYEPTEVGMDGFSVGNR